MRYVIIRDDDTNALTPRDCLERLYRPFLDRGMPVNLATIPCVSLSATTSDGQPEGFLPPGSCSNGVVPITEAKELLEYLRANPGFRLVQHGLHHTFREFDTNAVCAREMISQGAQLFREAGLSQPRTFVAPHDKFSLGSIMETTRHFDVVSTGWFEIGLIPMRWWPAYLLKKARKQPHWRAGGALLLSHPGCILSHNRTLSDILPAIRREVLSRQLTVLVTHWWEYFPSGRPNPSFIEVLHATAEWLANQPDVQVISFEEAEAACAGYKLHSEKRASLPTVARGSLARVPELH